VRKGRDLLSFWSAGVCLPGLVGAWGGNLNQHGGRIIIDKGQGGGCFTDNVCEGKKIKITANKQNVTLIS